MELVDQLEPRGGGAQHQIGVAPGADQGVRAQEMVLREVVAGGGELLLVAGALTRFEAPPSRVELEEGELDEMPAGHAS